MRRLILMFGLVAAAASCAMSQSVSPQSPPPPAAPRMSMPPPAPSTTAPMEPPRLPMVIGLCRGDDLAVRNVSDDAAMGGEHLGLYAFRNNSSTPCTLKGYPRFQLLNKAGRMMLHGQAINSQQLAVDDEKYPPQSVTVAAGGEAWFRIHYNSGGAGYMGKPCPTSSQVRIVAPGTTRALMLKDKITSCKTVEVSTVRPGPVPE
jgi:hypothetical protein